MKPNHHGRSARDTHPQPESVTITIDQLIEIIKTPLLANKLFEYCFMIWGPPGIGKSAIMHQLSAELGVELSVLMLNQLEPSDLKGLPVVDHDQEQVKYFKDKLLPRDPEQRGILFLDELTTASVEVSQAALRLIYERKIDDLKLPPGVLIIAAGNRRQDGAFTNVLSSAMASRFIHFELTPDVTQWTRWAREQEITPEIIDFLISQPRYLHDMSGDLEQGWPSPRTWEMLHKVTRDLGGMRQLSSTILRQLCVGTVGHEAGELFLDFLDMRRFWMSPEEFFEQLNSPLLINERRPDLRVRLLEEVVDALISKSSRVFRSEQLQPWMDGLFQRFTELTDTEVVLMLQRLASHLKPRERRLITNHTRFAELLKRLGMEALKCLQLSGQELSPLGERGVLGPRGMRLLKSIIQAESKASL